MAFGLRCWRLGRTSACIVLPLLLFLFHDSLLFLESSLAEPLVYLAFVVSSVSLFTCFAFAEQALSPTTVSSMAAIVAKTFFIITLFIVSARKVTKKSQKCVTHLAVFFHFFPFLKRRDAKSPLSVNAQRACFDCNCADDYTSPPPASSPVGRSCAAPPLPSPSRPSMPSSPLHRVSDCGQRHSRFIDFP